MPRRGPKLGDPTDFSYRIKSIKKIIDGDTIDVVLDMGFEIQYKSRIRLFGIDTPESRTRNKEEKIRGLLSKEYLKNAIKKSKKLTIKTHKGSETGKFGRILGEVFADGKNLNSLMCKEGYAVAYYGQNKKLIEAQHLKNKRKLIANGKLKKIKI
jgi:micrococcal nuclease|tara:strand:- start:173 stop:637 length:465 start_codon:yes stop_codon:yes gene_type:complete